MAAHSIPTQLDAATPAKLDLLGLAFFLFGAPHIYGALRQRTHQRSRSAVPKAFSLVLLAMAIAGLFELWLW
ncbi:MAG: hypothetical protein HC929_12450 [Leptolyngbyaceae cyanobacterium SM2_5_2]|nr:hypothetical protein [Leptolyngbyaceae cyanobacterium SM2_5_2]